MRYIILQSLFDEGYAAVDLSNDTIGEKWKDSVFEAIAELHRARKNNTSLKVFDNLRSTSIEDYPTFADDYFRFHSIADSDINPEFFI